MVTQSGIPPVRSGHAAPTQIAGAYDACAHFYDRAPNRARDLAALELQTHVDLVRGREAIELGCGTGVNTRWLARQARRVVAIDISPRMIARARARTRGATVTFVHHDVLVAWPAWIGRADVIISVLVMDHICDLASVFREACRWLSSDGLFLLLEMHPAAQTRGSRPRFRDPDTECEVVVPNLRHTIADYREAAKGAGFGEPRFRAVSVPPESRPVLLEVALRPVQTGAR